MKATATDKAVFEKGVQAVGRSYFMQRLVGRERTSTAASNGAVTPAVTPAAPVTPKKEEGFLASLFK